MYCPQCGCENISDTLFCRNCGFRFGNYPLKETVNYEKEKCKFLRSIRKSIAQLNHIDISFSECNNTEPCSGTCPMCESELYQLENALKEMVKRKENIVLPTINVSNNDPAFPIFPSKTESIPHPPTILSGVPAPRPYPPDINQKRFGKAKKFPWKK